jgi:UDPglucose 6-dehydrogenase
MKSTVPIGTCRKLSAELRPYGINVASNPEFLSEGNALKDFFSPSRIVVGAEKKETAESVLGLYAGIQAPQLICDLSSAEAIKHASNALLSVRLSFVNELAAVCEKMGADISKVTEGMGLDPRIGNNFLNPGPGWGGSCFPKDTVELAQSASDVGARMLTVEAAILSNTATKRRVAAIAKELLGDNPKLKKVAIWGLAFKANTDDVRESPAVQIASTLSETGARIVAFDPVVKSVPSMEFFVATSPIDACVGADLLVVLTEWDEFKSIDPADVREVMRGNAAVYDARGILNRPSWKSNFPRYEEIGQPTSDSLGL